MAHIISDNIVIKAILTKAGRQRLSSGINKFNITKFALADDEIDYTTDDLKENLIQFPQQFPILQPILNGNLMMRNRLYTDFNVNLGQTLLSYIQLNGGSWTEEETILFINSIGSQFTLDPQTIGVSSQSYSITVQVVGDMPFSSLSYELKETGHGAGLPINSGQKTYTMNGATKVIGIIGSLTESSMLIVDITGEDTGAIASYTFKFPANDVYYVPNQGDDNNTTGAMLN